LTRRIAPDLAQLRQMSTTTLPSGSPLPRIRRGVGGEGFPEGIVAPTGSHVPRKCFGRGATGKGFSATEAPGTHWRQTVQIPSREDVTVAVNSEMIGAPAREGTANAAPRRGLPPQLLLLLPTVIVLFVLTIYPTFFSFTLSLNEWNMSNRNAVWEFVGAGNYLKILQDARFWNSAQVTGTYMLGTIVTQLVLGLGIALLLQRQVVAAGLVRTALLLPMMTTPVVVGLIWRFMFNPTQGIVNYLLGLVGLPGQNWLGGLQTGLLSVMIADIWEWTPFMVLILLAALQTLPQEPYEAAAIDGASAWQAFQHLTLPLLRPTIVVAVLLRAIDSFKTFDLVYVMTNGGPGTSTETLSFYTYKWGFKFFQMGYASALSFVMLIMVIIFANILILATARKRANA
ncbi:MAG: sugar ABC transporter permease, partial [Thermomicrobiales bacterium]